MLTKIQLQPGINRDTTSYTNSGGWFDSDFIRFRNGLPEKIGGWTKVYANQQALIGKCRKLYGWSSLIGTQFLACPTNIKFYVDNSSNIIDITPLRRSVTLGTNPIATSNTSNVITITDVNHGAAVGNYITISGSSNVNGILTTQINKEHVISNVINANAYSVTTTGTATSTGSGGGSSVSVSYQFYPGVSTSAVFQGWGSGPWGGSVVATFTASISGNTMTVTAVSSGTITIGSSINGTGVASNTIATAFGTGTGQTGTYTVSVSQTVSSSTLTSGYGWGSGPQTTISTYYSGLWTVDNYGEDMVACPRDLTQGVQLGSNPISTTNNPGSTVTVTQANHGYSNGTAIIIGGVTSPIDGVPINELNGSHTITVVNANAYTFTTATTHNAVATGGTGAYVYLSSIVYWDVTDSDGPAVSLSQLGSAYAKKHLPYVATEVLVSDQNRQLVCFGANPYDVNQAQDKMIVRWSDSNDPTNWDIADTTKTSGEQRLSSGSYIVTAVQNREEILIWTDTSLYSMQYVGPPSGYGFNLVGTNFDIIGPNAKIVTGAIAYWMGSNNFYTYDGKVQPMPCTVRDYVFLDLSFDDGDKVYCSADSGNNEIIWFYPSKSQGGTPGSREVDRYVVFNYIENAWYYGSLARTAWIDRSGVELPRAVSPDGYLYQHESGFDDGSTTPASPINAYIQSSPIEIEEGNNFLFINRVIPDLTFRDSTTDNGSQPIVKFTIKPQDYPGAAIGSGNERNVQRNSAATLNVNRFTDQVFTRLRARSVALRVESDTTGVSWRLGTPRFDMRQDGRR